MLEQGIRLYGDPCRECGFTWSMSQADAEGVLAEIPGRMRTALAGSDGTARHPDLTWTAAAYICHVGDNLRIYAERMAGAAAGAQAPITEYDQNELAGARRYNVVPSVTALWALERAAGDWQTAVALCEPQTTLTFDDGVTAVVGEVVLRTTLDAHHHVWDVERSVGSV
jgi:hypothetical protein